MSIAINTLRDLALSIHGWKSEADLVYWGNGKQIDEVDRSEKIISDWLCKEGMLRIELHSELVSALVRLTALQDIVRSKPGEPIWEACAQARAVIAKATGA